ncbi:uncharacterized protein BDW47DRAFT_71649 [Aspergillus candidus]|uniref:Uncharacterized protein n=1 Tax=Aspergillus candidus TaxID=41067 RepID=A0A2I2F286_ASPCN|nr:hypothetical protein BDW47DRAFT_71649 [Aspergillus candidus]PLB34744.1 hypothetical protein BDW47DRAFT_71649 [Aspergillus candidus]
MNPPPYSPSSSPALPLLDEKVSFYPEHLLQRGLQIPSRDDRPSSGFPYPTLLTAYNVTPHHWEQFTREITDAARMTRRQWKTVVGQGLGVLAVGGLMVGALGAIPAWWVTRRAQRNREEQNLIHATTGSASSPVPGEEEDGRVDREVMALADKIQQWNGTFFEPRGILVRVDLPWEALEDLENMDVSLKGKRGEAENVSATNPEKWQGKASRRARIVLIPLDRGVQ